MVGGGGIVRGQLNEQGKEKKGQFTNVLICKITRISILFGKKNNLVPVIVVIVD